MDKAFFIRHLAQTTPHPILLEVDKAEGSWIFDVDGKKYLDMVSGIGVNHIGHCHPKVVEAITEQSTKYLHTMVYGEFVQAPQNKLVSLLISLLPEKLNNVYLVNSGTEANEGALKLAKRVTGRTRLIACRGGYHGNTHGSLSVSGNETKKQAFRPLLPDVEFIGFNNLSDLEKITSKVAAVIVETIQGDAGVRIPEKDWLQSLREKCNTTGTLLILDEIQCGMGRTGKMFAFEHFDIVPDILTLGKALGGGMPIGAFVAGANLMKQFTHNPMLGHITTFGGHPVVAAAGAAAIEVMLNEEMLHDVERKGQLLETEIGHPEIKAVRRIGLMFALDFANADISASVFNYCLKEGVIVFWFLSCPWSLRLAPPLNISDTDLRLAGAVIKRAIDHAVNIDRLKA